MLKACIIGAGSTYTPELIEGFLDKQESLDFQVFHLMDIDEQKLAIVGGLAERQLRKRGFNGEILLTTDLDRALDGADYVFAQIRVGKLPARIRDEKIPLKYGLLGQETTGAGGFMNGLRTVPVMMDIAHRMEKLCPDAFLINFSNPSGIVADALLNHTKIRTIGLCNCPINMLAAIEKELGTRDFDYDYVGLNHLAWITRIVCKGEDVLERLLKNGGANMKNVPELDYDEALLSAIPAIPNPYLSYYYLREKQFQKVNSSEQSRGEVCVELEASLLEQYKNPALEIKPPELASRGGALYSTAAVSVVDAIQNDLNNEQVVDVRNNGTLPFLEDSDVVEVKCRIGRDGATPLPIQTVDNGYITGLLRAVKTYERLTVKAALEGCRNTALAALMVHPLIGDYDKARAVLDDMLEANRALLPRFFR